MRSRDVPRETFWQRVRHGERVEGPVTLNHRRIFILPTRYGWTFGFLLFVMLLASINYNNSLGHFLTFFLGALGLVSILHTYRNLAGLTLTASGARPVFAGEEAYFRLRIDNPGAERRGIEVELGKARERVDVEGASLFLALPCRAERRGILEPGPLRIATVFPLGLFRAWSRLDMGMACLVYPRPSPPLPLPPPAFPEGELSSGEGEEREDFAGLRPYVPGDALGHVHWKASARAGTLLTKRFEGARERVVRLDWDDVEGDGETRLSVLCRLVLEAEEEGISYGLRLPGEEIPLGLGQGHREACLRALALFENRERGNRDAL